MPQKNLVNYYEAHVTIEPVFEDRLDSFKEICKCFGFHVAILLLKKRKEDLPERSAEDSFCTGRSYSYQDIEYRMLSLIKILGESGFKVWRYKIEITLIDSRYDDSKLRLDKEFLPEKEVNPRLPA